MYDFARGGGTAAAEAHGAPLYDHGFLNLYAPDLRPRQDLLRALGDDRKALAIVRIWEFLADEEAPVVRDHGTLERVGQSLVARPMRPVRSDTDFEARYTTAKPPRSISPSIRYDPMTAPISIGRARSR